MMKNTLQKFKDAASPRREPASPAFKTKAKSTGIRVTPGLISWVNEIVPDLRGKSSDKKDKEVSSSYFSPTPSSPASTIWPRRNSVVPRLAEVDVTAPLGGKMYVAVNELVHKTKPGKGEYVVHLVISVMKCTMATTPVDYTPFIKFEEGFMFDIHGTFSIKIEVFIQPKEKGKESTYAIPSSLGVLTFDELSVLPRPVESIRGMYYLTKDGKDTETSLTLQVAIKPHEQEDIERENMPAPDFSLPINYQVNSGDGYRWALDDCELRGRTLRFYNDNKKVKTVKMDAKTKAEKVNTSESEITLPYNCFQILVDGSPVYLFGRTADETKSWMEKLNKGAQTNF